MSYNVLVQSSFFKNNTTLTDLINNFCPRYGKCALVIPNEFYEKFTGLDPFGDATFLPRRLGHAIICVKSEYQVRFDTVLDKIKSKT